MAEDIKCFFRVEHGIMLLDNEDCPRCAPNRSSHKVEELVTTLEKRIAPLFEVLESTKFFTHFYEWWIKKVREAKANGRETTSQSNDHNNLLKLLLKLPIEYVLYIGLGDVVS